MTDRKEDRQIDRQKYINTKIQKYRQKQRKPDRQIDIK